MNERPDPCFLNERPDPCFLILGSSPRTVNKHLEHIFEKLGVTTRSAAVAIALQGTRH